MNRQKHGRTRWVVGAFLAIGLLALVATMPGRATTVETAGQYRYIFADLADQVLPSVVTVYVKRNIKDIMPQEQMERYKQFFDDPMFKRMFPQMPEPDEGDLPPSTGSGIIITADGYILTNHHVLSMGAESVADAKDLKNAEITVVLPDETEVKGEDVKLIDSSPVLDLAVLKINRTGLKPIKMGDSDKVRIGERVVAVGSPLDLRATVTQGIICAKHRDIGGGGADMLQTDAVINPGSSGGALVNMDGELIGINRLITSRTGGWQGYGFAIPSNDANEFAQKVMKEGKYRAGYIGVSMAAPDEVTEQMLNSLGISANQKGVLVKEVKSGTPAAEAGMHDMDYVIKADQTPIASNNDLLRYVMRRPIGETVLLTVLRPKPGQSASEVKLKLKVTERPSETELIKDMKPGQEKQIEPGQEPDTEKMLGLAVEADAAAGGLRVTYVKPKSPAAKAGLQEGDVITQFDTQTPKSADDLAKIIADQPKGQAHWAQFIREGAKQITTIKAE